MTYSIQENSLESGTPVELYEITLGSDIYRLTSAQDKILSMGNEYIPLEIERGSVIVGPEERDDMIELRLRHLIRLLRNILKLYLDNELL